MLSSDEAELFDDRGYVRRESATVQGGRHVRMGVNPPLITPIYMTAAYEFPDADMAAGLFGLEGNGHAYTRLGNPTLNVFEERMAQIDGGVAGLATASGHAAVTLSILNLVEAGDNIVSSNELFGGIWSLLGATLRRLGVDTRFVSPADPKNFEEATDDRTRLYFGETLPNPRLRIFPIGEVAEIGARYGIPLIMDNTLQPFTCRPFDHGAAVSVYSGTKYLGGHGSAIGGVIVDSGNFDWDNSPRHPQMTLPDPAYGNVVWGEECRKLPDTRGRSSYLFKARETLLRDLGLCLSPFNAFLILQGIETLPLRMPAHSDNALKVAEFLVGHPKVDLVRHPSLAEGTEAEQVERYLGGGFGPMVMVELKGGRKAGARFIEGLKLFSHVTNVGDVRSLATHPASTTHAHLPEKDLLGAGITQGSVRLAVGLEHPDDLIHDLEQALAAV
ncbi:O-acetylhomoserine aminocarboxypropyltransferase/cysteine synthase family protein [Streptomyces sp. NPDC050504]|uniref:O-acetylhomoserine aminocarboxypropyltransferase/cysteine synthase family protein n=1 Tax=Streptomyces sp. NPDC050504 TaxID=3365618 RepID=UPI00379D2977